MFNLLRDLCKYLKFQEIKTGSMIFRMHNIFTTVLLLMFSIIITATQFVGRPIVCMSDEVSPKIINTYCWMSSTFTMPDAFNRQIGTDTAHPRIVNDFGDFQARKYYPYYQWVCFCLFFQAMLCYFPQWLWNIWEGGLAKALVMGMNHTIQPKETIKNKKKTLTKYLLTHMKMHNTYVYKYFVCEAFCLVNIFVQIYAMNRFFGGDFITYGLNIFKLSDTAQDERTDNMVYVFPRVIKCIYHKYSPKGSIEEHDALCILSMNIFSEKIYIFIWFWFWILGIALIGLCLYRTALMSLPILRAKILYARHLPIKVCSNISKKLNMGDWWILYILSLNMDVLVYKDFLIEFNEELENLIKEQ